MTCFNPLLFVQKTLPGPLVNSLKRFCKEIRSQTANFACRCTGNDSSDWKFSKVIIFALRHEYELQSISSPDYTFIKVLRSGF